MSWISFYRHYDISKTADSKNLYENVLLMSMSGDIEYIKYITHANLNISLYVLIYIKMLPWKFRILNPKNRRVIHPYSSYISSKAGSFLTYSTFSVLFVNKHFANFTDKWFKNSYDMECEILRVLFSYEHEHVRRF